MKAFIGTSGWAYEWNKGGDLGWYVKNSGLNAIELNSSFYRFPLANRVKVWAEIGKDLTWIIKVNQLITHRFKFSEKSHGPFSAFLKLFKPMDSKIDYYLFQLPHLITPKLLDRIEKFSSKFDMAGRLALEVRNTGWFDPEIYARLRRGGITLVSIDSPIGSFIVKTSRNIYLRMHGRKSWYDYSYSDDELKDLSERIKKFKPSSCYIMFNNDHAMLKNASSMKKFLNRR